jgi:flagellar hook-length control protein FliK
MTSLMQSLGGVATQLATGQRSDLLKRPLDADFASSLADGEEALMSLFSSLGIPPESVTPEMLGMLQQWLGDGSKLPQAANDGRPVMLASLAQALQQSSGDAAPGVSPLPLKVATGDNPNPVQPLSDMRLEDLPKAFRALLEKAAQAPDALQQAVHNVASDALLQQGAKPQAAQPFTQVLTNNLLAMGVPQRVDGPGWDQAMGERLVWMVKGDQQTAELKLSPPNLGPLEVKLSIKHDQANVSFVSHHAAVRDALEAAIPRLRDMLAQESVTLNNVDVSAGQREFAQGHAQSQGDATGGQGWQGGTGLDGDADADLPGASMGLLDARGLGLIDLFA